MTDDLPPNRKDSSLELTAVRPRPVLPDDVAGMTVEMLADIERARRDSEDDILTKDSCPAAGCVDCATCSGRHVVDCVACGSHMKRCDGTCSTCSVCLGTHMLTGEEMAAWRRENEPPPSRPEAA